MCSKYFFNFVKLKRTEKCLISFRWIEIRVVFFLLFEFFFLSGTVFFSWNTFVIQNLAKTRKVGFSRKILIKKFKENENK